MTNTELTVCLQRQVNIANFYVYDFVSLIYFVMFLRLNCTSFVQFPSWEHLQCDKPQNKVADNSMDYAGYNNHESYGCRGLY
jgi:hypothetical protein